MDAVDSGIVVYGGGNIVFDTKSSNQWMQYTVDTVESWYMVVGTLSLIQKIQTSGHSMQWMPWNSGIWWWGHCLWYKKVKPVNSVDAVTQWTQYTVDAVNAVDAVHSGCSIQWMQYAEE